MNKYKDKYFNNNTKSSRKSRKFKPKGTKRLRAQRIFESLTGSGNQHKKRRNKGEKKKKKTSYYLPDVPVNTVATIIHLPDKNLHRDVASLCLPESILKPPIHAVRHHLGQRQVPISPSAALFHNRRCASALNRHRTMYSQHQK